MRITYNRNFIAIFYFAYVDLFISHAKRVDSFISPIKLVDKFLILTRNNQSWQVSSEDSNTYLSNSKKTGSYD